MKRKDLSFVFKNEYVDLKRIVGRALNMLTKCWLSRLYRGDGDFVLVASRFTNKRQKESWQQGKKGTAQSCG